jgi:hypothetical protein
MMDDKGEAESRHTGPDQVRPLPAGSNSAALRVVSLPSADASLSLPRDGVQMGAQFGARVDSSCGAPIGMAPWDGAWETGRWQSMGGIGVVCRRLDGILAVLRLWAGGGYAVEAFLAPVPTNFSWCIAGPTKLYL